MVPTIKRETEQLAVGTGGACGKGGLHVGTRSNVLMPSLMASTTAYRLRTQQTKGQIFFPKRMWSARVC